MKPGQRLYGVQWDGQPTEVMPAATFEAANADDAGVLDLVRGLAHGESIRIGGGAAPAVTIECVVLSGKMLGQ